MKLTKSGKPRMSSTGLIHKNINKPGAVSMGCNFTAKERDLWHKLQDYVNDNFPCRNPSRKREEISMIIWEAACTQLGLSVEVPEVASTPVNENQMELPGTNDSRDESTSHEVSPESANDEESVEIPDDVNEEFESLDVGDVEEKQENNDFAHDDDCEVLPFE